MLSKRVSSGAGALGLFIVGLTAAPGWAQGVAGSKFDPFPIGPNGIGYKLERVQDLNADGIQDVVLVPGQTFAPTTAMYGLGNERGEFDFVPAAVVDGIAKVGIFGEVTISAADIDGNGWPDIVSRTDDGASLWIVPYTENGPADPVREDTPATGDADPFERSTMLESGDLDGDGAADLIVYSWRSFVVRWSSRPEELRYSRFETQGDTLLYPPADLDDDGDLDVLIYDRGAGAFIVYPGTGSAKLESPVITGIELPTGQPAQSLVRRARVGQFGGGTELDLVFGTGLVISVVLDFATEQATRIDLPSEDGTAEEFDAPGDLDQNGFDDLLVQTDSRVGGNTVRTALWLNPGTNSFQVSPNAAFSLPGSWQATRVLEQGGDPRVDLVAISGFGMRSLFNVGPKHGWVGAAAFDPGGREPSHLLAVDLDGVGSDELVLTGSRNARIIRDIADQPTFELLFATEGAFMSACADVNGDTRPELIVPGVQDQNCVIFFLDESGVISDRVTIATDPPVDYLGIDTGDLNNDGVIDALLVRDDGKMDIRWGHPEAPLQAATTIEAGVGVKAAIGNFDADPDFELVAGLSEGGLGIFDLVDGLFMLLATIKTDASYWVDVEDIDGDGHDDIISTNRSSVYSPGCEIRFGDGSGSFDELVQLRTRNLTLEVAINDVNDDGVLDLVSASAFLSLSTTEDDLTHVYVQTEPRVFELVAIPASGQTTAVVVSDFDLDGVTDIATAGSSDKSIRFHFAVQPCPADLAPPFGVLNFFDLGAFLEGFGNQDPVADVAEPFGVWNFFDLGAFLESFGKGCP